MAPETTTKRSVKRVKQKKDFPLLDVRPQVHAFDPPPVRLKALEALRRAVPGAVVDFSPLTGSPSRVQSTGSFLTAPVQGAEVEPARVVEAFIGAHTEVFGHSAAVLKNTRINRRDVTPHNGMITQVWQQEVEGIPVFYATFVASLTKDGRLITLSSHLVPTPQVEFSLADAKLDAAAAIQKALLSVEVELNPASLAPDGAAEGQEQKQRFKAEGITDTMVQLTYLPMSPSRVRGAYDVVSFSLEHNEMFRFVVDAETGEVLYRRSLTEEISNASYRVFTSDSPSPLSPGHSTISSVQPPEVPRQLVTIDALDLIASPEGWIPDGGTTTVGNNVEAHTDTDANNSPDLPRPTSASRVFDPPLDLTQSPALYKDAAVVNLFYWSNWFHDRMYQLGFTETAGNFQMNNFGRGGAGNDPIQADAQDGSGTNNANFSTPPDGSPGRMQMFVWTGPNPDRDGDYEMEVVLHELAHGVSNRLVGGGVGMSANASRGMGEGWSDYYGLAMLAEAADDIHGNWARGAWSRYEISPGFTQNYYYGGRRYPYSTNLRVNPLTFQDTDPTKARLHTGIPRHPYVGNQADQVHNMGNVWCVALWDMRANLITKHGFTIGNELALRLITDGMKLTPANPNFLQARDGIIQADLVNSAGADSRELWAAFAKRGMGISAIAPPATVSAGVTESYDVPGSLQVTPSAAFNPGGLVGGPYSPSSQSYTLTNNSAAPMNWTASKTQTWTSLSSTSGTIAPGASTTIQWSINSDADTLPTGEQQDTLTITDTSSGLFQTRPLLLELSSTPVAQTITFDPIPPKAPSALPFALTATATSGLPVTFSVVTGPATVSGNTVTLTGAAGSVTIRASQAGNSVYLPAVEVLRSFVVNFVTPFSRVFTSPGGNFSYAITTDGRLFSWGNNGNGNLGASVTAPRVTPTQVGSATTWSTVSLGTAHVLGLRADGSLWSWGINTNGQLGNGTTSAVTSPTQIMIGTEWREIAAGANHSLAIRQDGTLWGWGLNSNGQLGDGTTTQRNSPVQIGSATNWKSVAAGGSHSIAITTAGELWAWGTNASGQLGDGTTTASLVPIRIGSDTDWQMVAASSNSSIAIRTNGTLWGWGQNTSGQLGDGTVANKLSPVQIGSATDWVKVSAGSNNTAARKSNGTIWISGSNTGGQLGNGTTTFSSTHVQFGTEAVWADMALGGNHLLVLRNDGTPWSAGEAGGLTGQSPRALALAAASTSSWTRFVATNSTFHALRSDGTLWGWGTGSSSTLGNGSTSDVRALTQIGTATDWQHIVSSGGHILGIRAGGTLWAWGSNIFSQLGNGSTSTSSSPVQIGTAQTWRTIAAGGTHSLGINTAGQLFGWGSNGSSQLGDGTTTTRSTPTQIGSITTWSKVAAGGNHSVAIRTDGTLWVWGLNAFGQLGDGTTTLRNTPRQIGSATDWKEIACANNHTLAIRTDGSLWVWGQGSSGQLGLGTGNLNIPTQVGTDTDWRSIIAFNNSSIAIKTDGSLWMCGESNVGQDGNGGLANVTSFTRIGTDTGWTLATPGFSCMGAFQQGVGFFTAGSTIGPRGLAATRDSRLIAPILPQLSPQSLVAPAASYPVYATPVTISTSSGLVPTLRVVSGPASVQGARVNLLGPGTVVLSAHQAGDNSAWNAIPPSQLSFTVDAGLPVHFATLGSNGISVPAFDARFVELAATLGFAPTLGTTLTLVNNTGSSPILGTIPGLPDGSYLAMSFGGISYGFRIDYTGGDGNDIVLIHEVGSQVITAGKISPKETTDDPFSITAQTTSTLPVTWSVVIGPASVVGNTVTLTGAPGAVTLKATQAGSSLWNPAPDLLVTFAVSATQLRFQSVGNGLANGHAAAIRDDGTLWTWGNGGSGQLGLGIFATYQQPRQVGTATYWSSVHLGNAFTLALSQTGILLAWGSNSSGQLGDGTTTTRTAPVVIAAGQTWANVSGGSSHSLGVSTNGTLWAWGSNSSSQLGDGTTTQRNSPVQIGTDTDWVSVSAGSNHSAAIKTNGTLWTWGSGASNQLGHGSTSTRNTPTQLGSDTNWEKVTCANFVTFAIRTDGNLWGWGSGNSGQLGQGNTTSQPTPVQIGHFSDWVEISSSPTLSVLARRADGSLWSWGSGSGAALGNGTLGGSLVPQRVGTENHWSHITNGRNFSMARRSDGTLWVWSHADGQPGTGPRSLTLGGLTGEPWTQVSSGQGYNLAIRQDGSLWSWGDNFYGQLGIGSTTDQRTPVQVGTSSNWRKVAAGPFHAVGVRTDGTLWAWGYNLFSMLGDGTTTQRNSPVQIGTETSWADISAGLYHSLAVKLDGTLWATGYNINGMIGNGTTTTVTSWTQVGTDDDWLQISASLAYTSHAIKRDGSLWGWGYNVIGQVGDGTSTQRNSPVRIGTDNNWAEVRGGGNFTIARRSNGTIWAWGNGGDGQRGTGFTTASFSPFQIGTATDWQRVLAGYTHAAAIKNDGSVWIWGDNQHGQISNGSLTDALVPIPITPAAGWVNASLGYYHTILLRNNNTFWGGGSSDAFALSEAGRDPRSPAPLMPLLSPQTVNTTPIGSNPYRFTASSGLPVQLMVVSGQATVTGDEVNVTGPPGTPVVLLAWQPGDEDAWDAAGPHEIILGTPVAPLITATTHANADGSGANLSATVNAQGTLTTLKFEYGTSPTLATFSSTTPVTFGSGTVALPSTPQRISGLAELTTYYYRAVASNAGGTTTSGIQSLTTLGRDITVEQPSGTPLANGVTRDFGDVTMGSTGSLTLTIRNDVPGTAITINSFVLTGANAARFSLNTAGMATSIGGGNSTSFSVQFSPLLAGTHTATLTINNNDPDEDPFLIQLTANGVGLPGPGQTIFGPVIPASVRFVSDGPITLNYGSTSGQPLTYTTYGSGGTLSGNVFSPSVTGGSVTIRIDQVGGSGYDPAPPVFYTFNIAPDRFAKLAIGPLADHMAAIKTDGTLWVWGDNSHGELGLGTTGGSQHIPQKVGTSTWTSVATGPDYTAAIDPFGGLYIWGKNTNGQLGQGDTVDRHTPTQVGSLLAWAQVACGDGFVVARRTNGTLWAWGLNTTGQLGLGNTTAQLTPVQIGTDTTWSAVAAGSSHVIARKSTGTLWAWGLNSSGQLGLGDTTSRTSPTQIGSLTTWGTKIACGSFSSYAIQSMTSGSLWAWGQNFLNQLGDGTPNNRSAPVQIGTVTTWTEILAGEYHGIARRTDGTLWTWGNALNGKLGQGHTNGSNGPAQIGTETNWTAVSGTKHDSYVLKTDGTLWTAGGVAAGALAAPPISPVPLSASALSFSQSGDRSLFIRANGTLWGVGGGNGDLGDGLYLQQAAPVQLGTATNWSVVRSGQVHNLALRSDGTLWAAGQGGNGQLGDGATTTRPAFIQIGAATWQQITCGTFYSLGIQIDGTLWAWGFNGTGQLGDGTTTQRTSPTRIGSTSDWAQVCASGYHSLGIKKNGTLWAWGTNTSGELGDSTVTQRNSPVQIGSATTWKKIACGDTFTIGLRTDGTLWTWGANIFGQLAQGDTTSRSTPTQVGSLTTLKDITALDSTLFAIRSDGTLWAAGKNSGLCFLRSDITSSTTLIQVGTQAVWDRLGTGHGNHLLATTTDGTLWAWGENSTHQLGDSVRRTSNFHYAHPMLAEQSIAFPSVHLTAVGSPVTLAATASSGLPVTYRVSGNATLNGNQLTVTGPGKVTLLAYQEGANPTWQNAPFQAASFTSAIADLASLETAAAPLTPAFDSSTTSYSITVPFGTTSVSFTPTAYDLATLTAGGNAVPSGQPTGTLLTLTGDQTSIPFTVTAQAGNTRTYTVHITRRTAFQQWAHDNNMAPSALDDSDLDHVPALHEFAFGLDPDSSDSGPIRLDGPSSLIPGTPIPLDDTIPITHLLFGRLSAYATYGMTYTVQFSDDLLHWQPSADTPTLVASDGTLDALTLPFPIMSHSGQKARFAKITVTAP